MNTKRHNYNKLIRSIYSFLIFFLNGYTIISEDTVIIYLKRRRKSTKCPQCNRKVKFNSEYRERYIRDFNLGPYKTYIHFIQYRIKCRCGYHKYEEFDFIRKKQRCTIRYEEHVAMLCEKMSIKDVSKITGLNWKTIKRIDKYYIKKNIVSLDKIYPTKLGVDEIAYEKGHKYLTIVRDLVIGKVIWIGLGRKKKTLDKFFKKLGKEKTKNIEVFVTDMWDPYIASIKKNCPSAEIVFDKFHVLKKINEALDKIRKKEFAIADVKERKEMKHKRFLILARNKNLKPEQKDDLEYLMNKNSRLYKAYILKEQIADIFEEDYENDAYWRLIDWMENVEKSKIQELIKCLKTIRRYFYGIYNYFKYKVTNAQSEGFNNKINIIKRRAYGVSDLEYFMLKIFQSCGLWQSQNGI